MINRKIKCALGRFNFDVTCVSSSAYCLSIGGRVKLDYFSLYLSDLQGSISQMEVSDMIPLMSLM